MDHVGRSYGRKAKISKNMDKGILEMVKFHNLSFIVMWYQLKRTSDQFHVFYKK